MPEIFSNHSGTTIVSADVCHLLRQKELSMKFALRNTVIAAATVSAAILLPTIALASSGSAAAPSGTAANTAATASGSGRCLRSQLVTWLGIPRDGFSNENNFYDLEISNISDRTCTLYGYPGVSAVNARGRQIGDAASRDGGFEALVTLTPDGTAHALVFIDYKGDFRPSQCHPTTASGLRVYAPGDFASTVVPFSFPACAKRGAPYLGVSTTVAGTGIPGGN
jgi:hypothetical protein